MFVRDQNGRIRVSVGNKSKQIPNSNPIATMNDNFSKEDETNLSNKGAQIGSKINEDERDKIQSAKEGGKLLDLMQEREDEKRKFLESLHSTSFKFDSVSPNSSIKSNKLHSDTRTSALEVPDKKALPVLKSKSAAPKAIMWDTKNSHNTTKSSHSGIPLVNIPDGPTSSEEPGIEMVSLDEEIDKHPKSYHMSSNSVLSPTIRNASSSDLKSGDQGIKKPKIQEFNCHLCSSRYLNMVGLSTHLERIHNLKNNEKSKYGHNNITTNTAENKPKAITHDSNESKDISYHEYLCLFCNAAILDKELLKEHISKAHFRPRAMCFHCPFSAKDQLEFSSHGRRQHYPTFSCYKLICLKCDFTSYESPEMIEHVNSVHSLGITIPINQSSKNTIHSYGKSDNFQSLPDTSHNIPKTDDNVKNDRSRESNLSYGLQTSQTRLSNHLKGPKDNSSLKDRMWKVPTKEIAIQTYSESIENGGNRTKEVAIQTTPIDNGNPPNNITSMDIKNKGRSLKDIDLIVCIFCRIAVKFQGLPATSYLEHLLKEHNILYDPEFVVEKTLDNNVASSSENTAIEKPNGKNRRNLTVNSRISHPITKPTNTNTRDHALRKPIDVQEDVFDVIEDLDIHPEKIVVQLNGEKGIKGSLKLKDTKSLLAETVPKTKNTIKDVPESMYSPMVDSKKKSVTQAHNENSTPGLTVVLDDILSKTGQDDSTLDRTKKAKDKDSNSMKPLSKKRKQSDSEDSGFDERSDVDKEKPSSTKKTRKDAKYDKNETTTPQPNHNMKKELKPSQELDIDIDLDWYDDDPDMDKTEKNRNNKAQNETKKNKSKPEDDNDLEIIKDKLEWPPEKGTMISTLYEDNFYIGRVCEVNLKTKTVQAFYMERFKQPYKAHHNKYWIWPKKYETFATKRYSVLGTDVEIEMSEKYAKSKRAIFELKKFEKWSEFYKKNTVKIKTEKA